MNKSVTFACILTLLTFAVISSGCGTTVTAPSNPDLPETSLSDHISWGIYDMTIDLENKSIEIVPNREMMFHFNINGYLHLCPGGCFRFWIVDITGTVLEIEMYVENPVKLVGYDVRIIFTVLNGKMVLNPDSYTDLFDPPSTPEEINPFIAFMKDDPSRMFPGSPESDIQTLFIDFPPGALGATTFIIDASYPGNCEEPYEINSMKYSGNLIPTGGSGTISCKVLDHQNDISYVHVDTTPLTGSWTLMNFTGSDTWEADITNSEGAPEGTYICLIKGESLNPLQVSTYNYVTVEVEPGTQDPCDGAINFFVAADGNWIVDGTIDIEDHDNEQFVRNILDYIPNGPAANYHTVYYWGGHGGSFRNGDTTKLQEYAESLGYTFRKQRDGDLNLDDVRVLIWPCIGDGDRQDPPPDHEINAIKNLLAQDGRVVITTEYDNTTFVLDWINTQLGRLGSSIRKENYGTGTNSALAPEDCEAYTHDVNTVYFRAWGRLYTLDDAFALFIDNQDEPMFMCEVLP